MSLKDFILMEKLGQGSYATVCKALRQTDQKHYAIKQIKINRLDEKSKQNALNQIRFLASFDCKNIVKYFEAFFEEEVGLLCIVMEFANQGDLAHLIAKKKEKKEKFYEVQIWKALIGLIHGIGYLHERSILHRDVKPQNIFLYNGNVKIGDLNVSKLAQQNNLKLTQIGTPYYASPQIWENKPYDNKCDVWSLGCVIYQMATLNPPFLAQSMDKLYEEVTKGKVKSIPKHYSNQLANIINRCLQKDASKRPSIKQLQQNFTIKMYENLYYSSDELQMEKSKYSPLLKTIALGKDKSITKIQLPLPNYGDQKQVKEHFPEFSQDQQPTIEQRRDQIIPKPNFAQPQKPQDAPKTQRKAKPNQNLKIIDPSYKIQAHSKVNRLRKIQIPQSSGLKQALILKQRTKNQIMKQKRPQRTNINPEIEPQKQQKQQPRKRSLPRTQLSAKKLHAIDHETGINSKSHTPEPQAPTKENVLDYKQLLCSKLCQIEGPSAMKGKKSIIEELIHYQQGNIVRKENKRQQRFSKQYCRLQNQVNLKTRTRGAQSSLNL